MSAPDFLYLGVFNSFLHFDKVPQHLEGIAENVYRAFAVIDYLYGHLHYLHTKLDRPQNTLKVKGKSVDLATREYRLDRLARECLTSALRI